MSSQTPGHAPVIPLRPALVTTTATPPAAARRAAVKRERPVVPGARPGWAAPAARLQVPLGGRVIPAQNRATAPASRPAREPLWRHVVGDVLRRERLSQRLRLKDVADAARISMPYLSEIERGRKEASSEVLAAAARALGLGLADLLALAQDELARFAPSARPRTADPVLPDRQPGAGRAIPGASEAAPGAAGRPATQNTGTWLAPPEQMSPPEAGQAGPPQPQMCLAA